MAGAVYLLNIENQFHKVYNYVVKVVNVMVEQEKNNELYVVQDENLIVDNIESDLSKRTKLISEAISGDKKAFSELYMQSYRYVFFVIRNIIPDDETTYDAIQETFIKVFKNISSLRSPEAYFSWLTTIAKNTAKNILRSRRVENDIDDFEDYSAFLKEDKFEKEVSLDVEAVLKKLEPQDAEILSLVYYDGMRVSQIAKMRNTPAATVYTQLNRAKRNLKSQLKIHGIDKTIYSGNFVAMVATAIRNIIGTSLLSVSIAQQILNSVVNGKEKKEIAVAKVIMQQQKKNILKIASCIVGISIITSVITVFVIGDFDNGKVLNNSVASSRDKEKDGNTLKNDDVQTDVSDYVNNSSADNQSALMPEDPPKVTNATYLYREATAEDCYTKENIPNYPIEDFIVITGVATAASDGVYIIPETIDGKNVGAIMPSAFNDPNISNTVKKVIVPNTVKTIWQNAFSDCYNLTDIYLRGSIINIFESAFADKDVRTATLSIHCSDSCKTYGFYYYKNIAKNYDAVYQEWDGSEIQ